MYITSFFLASRDVKGSPESQKSSSPRVHSGPLYKGFRTPDPEGNVMGQSTEMSPLVSMIFQTFLINPLNFYGSFKNSNVLKNGSMYFI